MMIRRSEIHRSYKVKKAISFLNKIKILRILFYASSSESTPANAATPRSFGGLLEVDGNRTD